LASGRSKQLTKQAGEYLVASKLCRLGMTATTFTGSVPDFDIVAVDDDGRLVLVQVKTVRSGSWQLGDARVFMDIRQDGDSQIVGETRLPKYSDLVFTFVRLVEKGDDRFFVLTAQELHELIAKGYGDYLDRHGGIRPRRHDSYHVGLKTKDLERFEGRWSSLAELHGRIVKH
jgi:hypothetical protein